MQGRGLATGKNTEKIAKTDQTIALLSLFQGLGGKWKKRPKIEEKKTKNGTIKPLSTISVSCMKTQGRHGSLCHPLPTPCASLSPS